MLHKFNKIKAMVKYEVDIRGKDIERIYEPTQKLDQEGMNWIEQ